MSGDVKLNIYTANYVKRDSNGRSKNNNQSQRNLNLFQFPENKDELYKEFLQGQKKIYHEPVKIDALEAIAEYIIDNNTKEDEIFFEENDENFFSSDNFFANGKYKNYYNSLDLSLDGMTKSVHKFLSITLRAVEDTLSDEVIYLPYLEKQVA